MNKWKENVKKSENIEILDISFIKPFEIEYLFIYFSIHMGVWYVKETKKVKKDTIYPIYKVSKVF